MPKFVDNNGREINSEFSVETISNFQGLIIESWGPSTRNPEYAKAFEALLLRLKNFGLPTIKVFVVSKHLIKVFPNIADREIFVDNKQISLLNDEIEYIRVSIGKGVSELKESQNSKGGNRYKRILIHSPLINSSTWEKLATSNILDDENVMIRLAPTSDLELLEQQVDAIESFIKEVPKGQRQPNRSQKKADLIERDPIVKAWILQVANGICELCNSNSPFVKDNGKPYLEVHHVKHLALGGSDSVSNVTAVCPNCHRALHYSNRRDELTDRLYLKVERLVRECN